MKIFAVANRDVDSAFDIETDMSTATNYHRGAAVIVAENLERAREILTKRIKENAASHPSFDDFEELDPGTLKEIKLDKEGFVVFIDGNC